MTEHGQLGRSHHRQSATTHRECTYLESIMLRRLVGSSSSRRGLGVVRSTLLLLGRSSLLAGLDGSLVVPAEAVLRVGALVGGSVLPVRAKREREQGREEGVGGEKGGGGGGVSDVE